jgi:sulfate permease, SulP family
VRCGWLLPPKIGHILDQIDNLPPIVILRLRNMTAIDATGLHALEDLAERLHKSGRTLLLCGAREQPSAVMRAAGLAEPIGEANICANIQMALERAHEVRTAVA